MDEQSVVVAFVRTDLKSPPDLGLLFAMLPMLLALLPVLLPLGWALLHPMMGSDHPEATTVKASSVGQLLLFVLPMLLAQVGLHLSRNLWQGRKSYGFWLLWAGGMACPLLLQQMWALTQVPTSLWGQTLGLALLYQWHLVYQRQRGAHRSRHWWSLDGVLALLLLLWTLAWALLLTSHEPGFTRQPIPLQLDWTRVFQNPLLWLSYFCQFALLALVMFGCYWLNRYVLIRKILAQQGLLPFVLISLALMLLSYAPITALLLQLPMNQPVEVPAVPGGNHNPFDWYNFNFMFLQWLFTTPLILAFERQQQDSTLAQLRQHQLQTELQLLQQQINPHFLFNTLNNLYALCLTKADSAPTMVLQLADLLRYVVYQGQQQQVTLQQELDYLQHYLALQQLRQARPLQLTLSLPADAEQYALPPLLLIMLLENAFKHGIEPDSGAGEVQLKVEIRAKRLYFECSNSVPEKSPTSVKSATSVKSVGSAALVTETVPTGMGLANLERRLRLLYGEDFRLHSGPDSQSNFWRAELQLPLTLVKTEDA